LSVQPMSPFHFDGAAILEEYGTTTLDVSITDFRYVSRLAPAGR
jgi:hypothetical protein